MHCCPRFKPHLLTHTNSQGPEIRTGFLENEQPVLLEAGHELTITTDYGIKVGGGRMACMPWCDCLLDSQAR